MDKESEPKEGATKSLKWRPWGKLWYFSVLVFAASVIVSGLAKENSAVVLISEIVFILSLLGGIISFIVALIMGRVGFIAWIFTSPFRFIFRHKITRFAFYGFLGLIVLCFLLLAYPSTSVRIDGSSMEPAFKDGEFYFVNRLASPKRSQIIGYVKDSGAYIGRVVGLPNETISIKPGEVKTNNEFVNEPYADWSNWAENREQQISLKGDEYLVLFDKRNGNIQVIKKENIIGVFYFRWRSPSGVGFIKD